MLSAVRASVFAGALLLVTAALLVAAASGAVALPLFLGGVGTFQVSAAQIRGDGFDLALAVDADSGATGGALPVGEIGIDRAEIDALRLEKEFDLTALLGPGGAGPWTLAITSSGTTTATGLRVDAAGVCADSIAFGPGFAVNGAGAGTEEVTDDLALGAPTITLGAPGIEAGYLTSDAIDLSGIRIAIRQEGPVLAPCAAAS